MPPKTVRIGDLLVHAGLVNDAQIESALQVGRSTGKRLGEILIELEIITEDQMLEVLGSSLNIERARLDDTAFTENLANLVPEELARSLKIVPYKLQANTLYIATSDPLDYSAVNNVGAATGKIIETVIASSRDIQSSLNRIYNKHAIDSMATQLDTTISRTTAQQLEIDELDAIENRVGEIPLVKFINNLVVQAQSKRASDIHIEPMEEEVRVRFRIDGELVEIVRVGIKIHTSIVTRIKIMGGMDIAEKRVPLDGRFTLKLEKQDVAVRVASMPTVYGEKIVMRILSDANSGILPLENLGFAAQNTKAIRAAARSPIGMILVTGPTGSGKSTTLYSLLNELSTVSANVLSVEDPVEKKVRGVNQTQVNARAGLTFASGLRAILRQDPDKIMIGEIRDFETADVAAKAAMTGHLVLGSMHTNSASAAYMRLMNMGVEPFVVASSVICVIAQRLIRLICTHCKKEYTPALEDLEFMRKIGINYEGQTLYQGTGCTQCDHTGCLGRTTVVEVISTDVRLRDLIMANASTSDIENYLNTDKRQKYMLDEGKELVLSGRVNLKELINLTQSLEF